MIEKIQILTLPTYLDKSWPCCIGLEGCTINVVDNTNTVTKDTFLRNIKIFSKNLYL